MAGGAWDSIDFCFFDRHCDVRRYEGVHGIRLTAAGHGEGYSFFLTSRLFIFATSWSVKGGNSVSVEFGMVLIFRTLRICVYIHCNDLSQNTIVASVCNAFL